MSIWKKTSDEMPPLEEEVLILFKDKNDKLKEDNLYYAIARLVNDSHTGNRWSRYTEYQGYYEVVFWCPLIDMPRIVEQLKEQKNEWCS